jgi:hypothetical protein
MTEHQDKNTDFAIKSISLLRDGRSAQSDWLENVDKWNKFANLSQWSSADDAKLKRYGLPRITHDFILPAVEQGVSFLTFNTPRFHAIGVTGDDVDLGMNVSDLAAHMWKISSGDLEFKSHAYDYYVKSEGVWMLYEDPDSDQGRGDLKIFAPDPRDIVWDADAKDVLCRDASWVIYTKKMTRKQARLQFPDYAEKIEKANGDVAEDSRNTSTILSNSGFTEYGDFGGEDGDKLDYIERFEKKRVKKYKLLFNDDGTEIGPLTQSEFNKANEASYGILSDGQQIDIVTEDQARQVMADPNIMINVEIVTLDQLIENELVSVAEFWQTRVMKYCSLSDQELYKEELPISEYPIVPCFNKHNGNPFALSDVAGAISPQEFANKMISLVTEHTQRTVSSKVLFPRGMAGDLRKLEEMLTKPGPGVGEYNAEALAGGAGAGIVNLTPGPLSNAAIALLADAKHKIEYQFGIFENMMGSGQAAPETFKGTMAIDEFGQRRMRAKLQAIERALSFAGTVWLEWASSYYDIEKIVRISEPGTEPREIIFNQDQEVSGAILRNNDLSRAKYDLVVAAGSSTPVNRWAEIESMKEIAFNGGITELLPAIIERLDIPNGSKIAEQVAQRADLSGQLQAAKQRIRDLEGDLQTTRRESLSDEKRVELMKFKSKLDALYANVKAEAKVSTVRAASSMDAALKDIINDIEVEAPMETSFNEGFTNG